MEHLQIWDEGEDSVMNSYEFFGWHNVKRGTRPIKSATEIKEAYVKNSHGFAESNVP